ncbi:MAG: nuclear transport factor 2 family protein [bacterium]|nr:nuclear transport factor 2 family protein [bacterium]
MQLEKRAYAVSVLALLVVATAGCASQEAVQAEEEAPPSDGCTLESAERVAGVSAAHEAWIAAYQQADVEALGEMLDTDGPLSVFHPFVENRFNGAADVRGGMAQMFARVGRSAWSELKPQVVVEGDVGWVVSDVMLKSPGLEASFVGRGTEIWICRAESWKLAHAHWSEHAHLAGSNR